MFVLMESSQRFPKVVFIKSIRSLGIASSPLTNSKVRHRNPSWSRSQSSLPSIECEEWILHEWSSSLKPVKLPKSRNSVPVGIKKMVVHLEKHCSVKIALPKWLLPSTVFVFSAPPIFGRTAGDAVVHARSSISSQHYTLLALFILIVRLICFVTLLIGSSSYIVFIIILYPMLSCSPTLFVRLQYQIHFFYALDCSFSVQIVL